MATINNKRKKSGMSSADPHRATFSQKKTKTAKAVPFGAKAGKSPSRQAAAIAQAAVNPFERLKQTSKFEVMGRKLKGTERDVGQARSRAIQQRKESLLVEFKQADKRNSFTDRRFGEDDTSLTVEDKYLKRFQQERIKKTKFSLQEDGDGGDEEQLTHMGTSLSHLDEDDLHGPRDDDQEDNEEGPSGELDEQRVSSHFGGGAFGQSTFASATSASTSNQPRTREEIMREVVAKSKMFKIERQQSKEQTDTMIHSLDSQFGDIRTLMEYRPSKLDTPHQEPDEFERRARALVYDARVAATDRTRSTEEIARDEHARLEKLESERQARMHGHVDKPNDDQENDHASHGQKKQKTLRSLRATDDDLDEDVHVAEVVPDIDYDKILAAKAKARALKSGDSLADDFSGGSDEGSDEGSDGSDDDGLDAEEISDGKATFELETSDVSDDGSGDLNDPNEIESSDDDKIDSLNDGDDSEELPAMIKSKKSVVLVKSVKKASSSVAPVSKESMKAAQLELPFVFEAPETFEALHLLLAEHTVSDRSIIISRLRTCHHISLAAGNRAKLQRLFNQLWHYQETVGEDFTSQLVKAKENNETDKITNAAWIDLLAIYDMLCPHLFELGQQMPGMLGKMARDKLAAIQRSVFNHVNEHKAEVTCFPTGGELCTLRLIGQLFSVSDARHPVVTPTLLFLSQCLTQVPVRGGRDLCAALFIVSLMLAFQSDAKRFVPELVCFLRELLVSGFELSLEDVATSSRNQTQRFDFAPLPATFRLGSAIWKSFQVESIVVSPSTGCQLPMRAVFLNSNSDAYFTTYEFQAAALHTTLQLITKLATMYTLLPSFPEIFQPFLTPLTQVRTKIANNDLLLQKSCDLILSNLTDRIVSSGKLRRPLEMRKFRPIAIRSLVPAFDEHYFPGKDVGTDAATGGGEQKRMKRKLRQEKRGAVRELRKDATFLALERRQLSQRSVLEKDTKRKANARWMNEQAADMNPYNHEREARAKDKLEQQHQDEK